jgi:hypothetical protein
MFGIKKLQIEINELKQYLTHYYDLAYKRERTYFQEIDNQLSNQKIDLSKINTRFHDLGEKFDKTQEAMLKVAHLLTLQENIHQSLLDKVVTDDAIMQHVKELNDKLTFLFDYMKQLEKLLGNVELIVDQCLPEKTIKLPKKKKTS